MLDLLELAFSDNPKAVEEVRRFREEYGDVQYPPPDTHLLALSIRDRLRDSGAKNETCQAVVNGIISGRLRVDSVEELAETEIGILRKVPGMNKPILNDLREAVWRLELKDKDEGQKKIEQTGESQIIIPETAPKTDSYQERLERSVSLIDQLLELKLTKRTFNALKRSTNFMANIRSVEDFIKMSDSQLKKEVKNFGDASLIEFREKVDLQAERRKQP